MGIFLAIKEVWRNRGRFFLFSLVIALITTLVLFTAALSEGLALANKEYLSKLDAELLVFQKTAELSASASRIDRSKLNDIRRIEGVKDIGSIGFSMGTIVFPASDEGLNVSLVGVEAGKPGVPQVMEGSDFTVDRGEGVIIDKKISTELGLKVGERFTVKTIQSNTEKFFDLKVIGITDGRQYMYQPSVFVPYRTWDNIRAQAVSSSSLVEITANVVAIKLVNPEDIANMAEKIKSQVPGIDAVDIKTAYESIPGYQAQQSTLNTQQAFTLLIGILVIGGFFQIQMLQKVPLIGVLKAIGASNLTVATAVVLQIMIVTAFGVLLGSLISLGLSFGLPARVPIVFNGSSVLIAIVSLLAIGPLGGLVSVRLAISVEPLRALGLSS